MCSSTQKNFSMVSFYELSVYVMSFNKSVFDELLHTGFQRFISVSHLCTGPMESKTPTPWILLEMIIYLVLLTYGFSTGISIAKKEDSVAKKEDSWERGLSNNNKNH